MLFAVSVPAVADHKVSISFGHEKVFGALGLTKSGRIDLACLYLRRQGYCFVFSVVIWAEFDVKPKAGNNQYDYQQGNQHYFDEEESYSF